MIEVVVLALFFGLLVVGSLVANAFGRLPDADELEKQDHTRFARYERSL